MFPLTASELLQPLLSPRLKEFIKWMLLLCEGLAAVLSWQAVNF